LFAVWHLHFPFIGLCGIARLLIKPRRPASGANDNTQWSGFYLLPSAANEIGDGLSTIVHFTAVCKARGSIKNNK
jgi:hypothetical protein